MAATSPASTPMASVKSTGVGCPLTWLMIQPPAQPRAAPSRAVIRVRKVTRAIRSARVTPRVRRRPRSRRRINTSANTTAATKNPPAPRINNNRVRPNPLICAFRSRAVSANAAGESTCTPCTSVGARIDRIDRTVDLAEATSSITTRNSRPSAPGSATTRPPAARSSNGGRARYAPTIGYWVIPSTVVR